jgi:replication initiation and membrane attachment protein DnaB
MRAGIINEDKMTCTMLGAWLTELFLHERSEQLSHHASIGDSSSTSSSRDLEASQRMLLTQFLHQNVNNVDARTIMKILTSHDVSVVECATYAAKSGDIATAVNYALGMGYKDAVSTE